MGGRRTRVETKGKATQSYAYDAFGNITGLIDGAGNRTVATYLRNKQNNGGLTSAEKDVAKKLGVNVGSEGDSKSKVSMKMNSQFFAEGGSKAGVWSSESGIYSVAHEVQLSQDM